MSRLASPPATWFERAFGSKTIVIPRGQGVAIGCGMCVACSPPLVRRHVKSDGAPPASPRAANGWGDRDLLAGHPIGGFPPLAPRPALRSERLFSPFHRMGGSRHWVSTCLQVGLSAFAHRAKPCDVRGGRRRNVDPFGTLRQPSSPCPGSYEASRPIGRPRLPRAPFGARSAGALSVPGCRSIMLTDLSHRWPRKSVWSPEDGKSSS